MTEVETELIDPLSETFKMKIFAACNVFRRVLMKKGSVDAEKYRSVVPRGNVRTAGLKHAHRFAATQSPSKTTKFINKLRKKGYTMVK